jgi:small subunit ribosomal protein S9
MTQSSLQSGGRKTARASVRVVPNPQTTFYINGKPADIYFQQSPIFLQYVLTPYEMLKTENEYKITIHVEGGGLSSQAQAIRLALCKSFSTLFPNLRGYFKKHGFLTRDARIKERRKYGLKKARKASQYSKR